MTKRRKVPGEGLPVIHPRAVAIDAGSRFHVVAVPSERDSEPVQTFQALNEDLQRVDVHNVYRRASATRPTTRVQHICRVLKVSASGFYDWQGRAPPALAPASEALSERIARRLRRDLRDAPHPGRVDRPRRGSRQKAHRKCVQLACASVVSWEPV